ncbi:hypothetical protein BD779DRAFT_1483386 [Infundibulicybe gibba]|nr:hypothetical protein BD779DRAFT_1483386 [Infundibulicybe gibba]
MARKVKSIPGVSHLGKILTNLNSAPKLSLSNLKSLKLTLAFQNDHFGARHFVKEQLPRIRYANPGLEIQVDKVQKTAEDKWRPEMELEFADGQQHTLDMHEKWSTVILKELMEMAGGDPWKQWKAEATSRGLAVIPGEEKEPAVIQRPNAVSLPSLKLFRASSTKTPPISGITTGSASV